MEHDFGLFGWGLLVACSVSVFRGDSGASANRALWSAFLPDFYLILMNITSTLETNTNFLTQLQNLGTL